jgi:hypothetical protein
VIFVYINPIIQSTFYWCSTYVVHLILHLLPYTLLWLYLHLLLITILDCIQIQTIKEKNLYPNLFIISIITLLLLSQRPPPIERAFTATANHLIESSHTLACLLPLTLLNIQTRYQMDDIKANCYLDGWQPFVMKLLLQVIMVMVVSVLKKEIMNFNID